MPQFRKKPVVVQAVRWSGEDAEYDEIEKLAENGPCTISITHGELYIQTLEGIMHADFGDWVIKGVSDEIYPCKADIFAATYDAVVSEERADG